MRTESQRQQRRAWKRAKYAARQLVAGRLVAPVPGEQHGKKATYCNHGCRCRPCTAANSAETAKFRAAGG